ERVVGTSQMAGTEMLRIADLSAMELLVEVGENDVVKIAPGAKAWVKVDACPENQITGKVVKIANSASDEVFFEGVANFAVKIELGSTGKGIRPGMSASASILAGMRDSVVTVPIQSVFYNNGKEKIWVLDQSGKVRERIVTTGLRDLSSIEIISGLEPGEKIVTAPYSAVSRTLYDGCPVAVKE
ncbi:MAG: efflux RND transporter periplasmic adaptor subunit, partial [Bacteroidales bacterium]|nr:efflux RND transporter periplasmic adaptor subunit [Bacteroidales bacterium]